jgi:hypothetical protein
MPKQFTINFLHACENAFFSNENKLNVINIFNEISIERNTESVDEEEKKGNYPAIAFSIAINFSGDFNNQSEEKISILDPEKNEVAHFPLSKINSNPSPVRGSSKEHKTNFVINMQSLLLKTPGTFTVVIRDNKNKNLSEEKDLITLQKNEKEK